MRKLNQIYQETKKREDGNPKYAADLAEKRSEGQEFEAGIIQRVNFLSQSHSLLQRSGHSGTIGAGFFSTFDAELRRGREVVTEEVELKGRPQWEDVDFPYDTVIVNENKVHTSSDSSLIVWCNKSVNDCLWLWGLPKIKQFPTRSFEINKRKGMQRNNVYDIPVSFLSRGFDSLVSFLDRRFYEV